MSETPDESEPDDDEPCPQCRGGDRIPPFGYYRCPVCDAEWADEDDGDAP